MAKIKWDDPKCRHFLGTFGLCNREHDVSVNPDGSIIGGSQCPLWGRFGWPNSGAKTEDCKHYAVRRSEDGC